MLHAVAAGLKPGAKIRLERVDGGVVEGSFVGVHGADLFVLEEHTGEQLQIASRDVRALDVWSPRRGRELMLAIVLIVVAVAALVGISQSPGFQPDRHIYLVFVALTIAVTAILQVGPVQRFFQSVIERRDRLSNVEQKSNTEESDRI